MKMLNLKILKIFFYKPKWLATKLMLVLFLFFSIQFYASNNNLIPAIADPCTAYEYTNGSDGMGNKGGNYVGCGNAANTEGISAVDDYSGAGLPGSAGCNGAPAAGQEVLWIHFKLAADSYVFQFQIVPNMGTGDIYFELHYADPDCNNLTLAACGEGFSSWADQNSTVMAPNPSVETDYYLAVWTQDPADDEVNVNFKSRRGCQDFDDCIIASIGNETAVCNVGSPGYTFCFDMEALNGDYDIIDPLATSIMPSSPVTYGGFPVASQMICLTYPNGVDYDVVINEQGNPAPGANGHDPNCYANLSGSAPNCCNLTVTAVPTDASCSSNQQHGSPTNDGTITLTPMNGSGPYTWAATGGLTGNGLMISPLAPGTYTVTLTDANGCMAIAAPATIGEPTFMDAQCARLQDNFCVGGMDGIAMVTGVGGTPPYSYLWQNGATTATINNLTSGLYSVTVTDARGCKDVCAAQINDPAAPFTVNCTATDELCNDQNNPINDGTATATPNNGTAPYSYLWSNGQTTMTATGLNAGTYDVTVTDANGCMAFCNATVNEPTFMDAQCARLADNTCAGGMDGIAMVTGVGGTPPYSYLWQNGATTATINNLTSGLYSVTVTDANGCQDVCAAQINDPVGSITCPNPMTFECGDDAGIQAWLMNYTLQNICPGDVVMTNYDPADFPKCATTTKMITFSVKNAAGQTIANCVSNLTINAALEPTATPPGNITIDCISAPPSSSMLLFSNGQMGDCSIGGNISSIISGSHNSCGGSYTETWTFPSAQNCGRGDVVYSRIISVDPAPEPTATPPGNITIDCNSAPPSSSLLLFTNGQLGNCFIGGNINSIITGSHDECGGGYTETWTFLSADNCNRGDVVYSRTISVNPAPEPTATPPGNTTIDCTSAPPTSSMLLFNNGLTGNCFIGGNIASTISGSHDECGGGYTETWTFPSADNCNRGDVVYSRTISVNPAPEPTATPPSHTTIDCNDAPPTSSMLFFSNGLMGDCFIGGNIASTISGSRNECGGSYTETWTFPSSDNCNRGDVVYSRTISVDPAPEPTATPPGNINIDCTDAPPSSSFLFFSNGLMGNCFIGGNISSIISGSHDACGGTYIETWTFSSAQNCGRGDIVYFRTITVDPAPEPIATPPGNITIDCISAPPTSSMLFFNNGQLGNCFIGGNVASSFTGSHDACGGSYTETWTFPSADNCNRGNVVYSRTITINPAPEPTATPPGNITIDCISAPPTSSMLFFGNGFMGDCFIGGNIASTISGSHDACGGSYIETWTFLSADNCNRGDVVYSRTISVDPAPQPTAMPSGNITIACTSAPPASTMLFYTNGQMGDCFIGGNIASTITGSHDACGGSYTEIWTFLSADNCNRGDVVYSRIISVDPAPEPTATPPGNITIDCTSAPPTSSMLSFSNGLMGDCFIGGSIASIISGTHDECGGSYTETWTFPSANNCGRGNVVYTRLISVDPAPQPTAMPPGNITMDCTSAPPTSSTIFFTNGLGGNCFIGGNITSTITGSHDECGGSYTETWTFLSANNCNRGNVVYSRTISVDPAPEPTATPPGNITIDCISAPPASTMLFFSNGLMGDCFIGGNVASTITGSHDECGGSYTETWTFLSANNCNRGNVVYSRTISVNPAPEPTATPPSNITINCISAPPASTLLFFSNAQPGVCFIGGNITSTITGSHDACGGSYTETWTFLSTNNCNRGNVSYSRTIFVNPAPIPTIAVPSLPSNLTCEEAQNYYAPITTFSNGLGGSCNNSGYIQAKMVKDIDACYGGTITVTYDGFDECGNYISAQSIVISVDPAPAPTVTTPDIYGPVYCFMADSFDPGNATYTNGLTGECENSGEIVPVLEHYWDACNGGLILIKYSGFDNCGNPLVIPNFKEVWVVEPDTNAPYGECVEIEEYFNRLENAPGPDELQFYKDSIASHYYDDCSEVVVTLVGDTGKPVCELDGTFSRVYYMEVADECGNVADTCALTFKGTCNPLFCTLKQDFYAGKEYPDSLFGYSSLEIIDSLLGYGEDSIFIGTEPCGFILDDAVCVQNALSGHGQSISLSPNFNLECNSPLNNVLVNQVITTILNIRYNELFNPNGPLDFGNYQLDALCKGFPEYILDSLPADPTINDLVDYANDFIGCQCTGTCGEFNQVMADLTCSFLTINVKFDKCFVPGSCFFDASIFGELSGENPENKPNDNIGNGLIGNNNSIQTLTESDDSFVFNQFEIFPNPASQFINVAVPQIVGKQAKFEIYNVQGIKMYEMNYTEVPQPTFRIDVNDYSNGVYMISIQVEGKEPVSERFIVRK